MGDLEKYGLIAAAAALFFWPQIQAFLKKTGSQPSPTLSPEKSAGSPVTTSRTVGSDRSEWITDLLAMQRVLQANGQSKAADLIAESMVLIVGMKTEDKK